MRSEWRSPLMHWFDGQQRRPFVARQCFEHTSCSFNCLKKEIDIHRASACRESDSDMRDPNQSKSPPTIAYQAPRVSPERGGSPVFRTRLMLVVPRVVQLDSACIK